MISFEDNFNWKGNLLFAIFFDFETTALTDKMFDPEQNKMFIVSYVLIVTFHPNLNSKKIIIQLQWSFGHSLQELMQLIIWQMIRWNLLIYKFYINLKILQ